MSTTVNQNKANAAKLAKHLRSYLELSVANVTMETMLTHDQIVSIEAGESRIPECLIKFYAEKTGVGYEKLEVLLSYGSMSGKGYEKARSLFQSMMNGYFDLIEHLKATEAGAAK